MNEKALWEKFVLGCLCIMLANAIAAFRPPNPKLLLQLTEILYSGSPRDFLMADVSAKSFNGVEFPSALINRSQLSPWSSR